MKGFLNQKELIWTMIIGVLIWNVGLTFRAYPPQIVTLDMAKVVRSAAHLLAEVSEGDDLEFAKDKLAHRLRAIVQAYADRHKAFVVDVSTIIAGETRDITEEVIKEVTR